MTAAFDLHTNGCQVDTDCCFGIARESGSRATTTFTSPNLNHSATITPATRDRQCFEEFADSLGTEVYRRKRFCPIY